MGGRVYCSPGGTVNAASGGAMCHRGWHTVPHLAGRQLPAAGLADRPGPAAAPAAAPGPGHGTVAGGPGLPGAAQRDATLLAIRAQEEAGLDILTDGEMCRESYSNRFATALDGVDLDHPGVLPGRSRSTNPVPRVTGPIRRRHPVEAADAAFLRASTRRTVQGAAAQGARTASWPRRAFVRSPSRVPGIPHPAGPRRWQPTRRRRTPVQRRSPPCGRWRPSTPYRRARCPNSRCRARCPNSRYGAWHAVTSAPA